MKIFFTNETKKLDEYTIEHEPVSSIDLMERAASSVTFEIISRWKRNTRVVVFAGSGNNGGDALAVSRMLIEEGYKVEIFLFNPFQKLSPDCSKNRERLKEIEGVHLTEVVKGDFLPPLLDEYTLVIDGLFGSGLRTGLTGGFASVVQYINAAHPQVVSIDLPSGLFGEDNRDNYSRNIIRATLTLTFQYPKLAFMLPENAEYIGEWKVIDIGIHPEILDSTPSRYFYLEPEEIAPIVKPRKRFSDKREYGHTLMIAGSKGMIGAAVLSTKAALHTGAGLVTVHTAQCGYEILQSTVPEAMVQTDNCVAHITEIPIQRHYKAMGIGPGIGKNEETARALEAVLPQLRYPVVIDADALNLTASHQNWLAFLPAGSILTPHIREFDRIFGQHDNMYERLGKAAEISKRYNLIIILKGAYTAIITPKEKIYFNSTGNPGMATAGSGDVLTGILTGLLSQGYASHEAAVLGTFLHGMAGDLAAEELSEEYITAGDIITHIGKAFKKLKSYFD
ncbi:NAD(P)H-hydrate dehydratase [Coprobacter tertius]|uniref:Bifunctional NAD(P)H-hydrate repair enzyme n=1 Tax=Coprobacter tertius TaxID=2944915 RepID=A0ABT1MGX2_9BACT|nr:NAD(P)H-hydrate dehydratase [Coprobacter tertius]MCP9611609.1 NAD(P)H-hydrate dehydratase [Coprobacter tertius]